MTYYFETLEESRVVLRGELQGDWVFTIESSRVQTYHSLYFVTGLTLATKCNLIKAA